MPDNQTQPDLIGRRRRQLTSFFANELLYDYFIGKLDDQRRQAMEESLREDTDLQKDLKKMQAAELYLSKLAETKISSQHIHELINQKSNFENFWIKMRLKNWPLLTRWVMEALLISFSVSILFVFVPWSKIANNILRREKLVLSKGIEDKKSEVQTPALTPKIENSNLAAPSNLEVNTPASGIQGTSGPSLPSPDKLNSAVTPSDAKTVVEQQGVINPAENKTEPNIKKTPIKPKLASSGLVYSMVMSLPDTPSAAQGIKNKIVELGGIKAGQVELGWRKSNPAGSYFHFSMPEENYSEFIKTLDGYGRVRIYKNPHKRIMPAGQIRIILWIEDEIVTPQNDEEKQN